MSPAAEFQNRWERSFRCWEAAIDVGVAVDVDVATHLRKRHRTSIPSKTLRNRFNGYYSRELVETGSKIRSPSCEKRRRRLELSSKS